MIESKNVREMQDKLEFLVRKCYISGFGSRVRLLRNHVDLFFGGNKVVKKPLTKIVGEIDAEGALIPTTSVRSRDAAFRDYTAVLDAYTQLPWITIMNLYDNTPESLFSPFADLRLPVSRNLQPILLAVLGEPDYPLQPAYTYLQDTFRLARKAAKKNEQNIASLKAQIKEKTGKEAPTFIPAFEIHLNPDKYIGARY